MRALLAKRPTFWIYPYAIQSQSAKLLASALGGKVIRPEGSRYREAPSDFVINWGASQGHVARHLYNAYDAVRCATSKMATFGRLIAAGVQCPPYTTEKSVADGWILRGRVLGRDLDRGSQGRGITVYDRGSVLGNHPFYVRVMKKERELRLHVMGGKVFWMQEKLRKRNVPDVDPIIRSHARGWCFAHTHFGDAPVPGNAISAAVNAVAALGLDFGAVDLGLSEGSGVTVFEVNTAPGIEESTLLAYADAFQALLSK